MTEELKKLGLQNKKLKQAILKILEFSNLTEYEQDKCDHDPGFCECGECDTDFDDAVLVQVQVLRNARKLLND